MSTHVPSEAKQDWIKPSVERRFNRYSTSPQCIDGPGEFLSRAFLKCTAELRLNTAEPLGSRDFYELTPTAPPCPSRSSEDRVVALVTTMTSASSATS